MRARHPRRFGVSRAASAAALPQAAATADGQYEISMGMKRQASEGLAHVSARRAARARECACAGSPNVTLAAGVGCSTLALQAIETPLSCQVQMRLMRARLTCSIVERVCARPPARARALMCTRRGLAAAASAAQPIGIARDSLSSVRYPCIATYAFVRSP